MSFEKIASTSILDVKRTFMWRLNRVQPSESETKKMNETFVADNEVIRAFLCWRRSNMTLALPTVCFSFIWNMVLYSKQDVGGLNGFGKFIWALPYFASLFLFIAVVCGAVWWSDWRRTRLYIKIGWGLSFLLPFLPALFPIEMLLSTEKRAYYYSSSDTMTEFIGAKFLLSLQYAGRVLPLLISFPGGAVRAAVRIRGLLPQSSLSSWILVISAPFYSLLILIGLVMLLQLYGNFLLIIGVLILTLNPWIYVVFRRLYTSPKTDKDEKRLDLVQKIAGFSNLAGLILVLIWALTSGLVGEYGYVQSQDLVRFIFVMFANGSITSIVFCDAFLRMTVSNWKMESDRRTGDSGPMIDDLFQAIEGSIRKPQGSIAKSKATAEDSPSSNGAVVQEVTEKKVVEEMTERKEVDYESSSSISVPELDDDDVGKSDGCHTPATVPKKRVTSSSRMDEKESSPPKEEDNV